jgi:multisubunit Na+/H+ antiporter MnhB subunit
LRIQVAHGGAAGKAFLTQLVRFAMVGGIGLVVDVAIFNLLRVTVCGYPSRGQVFLQNGKPLHKR